jgi:hypothetical protein
MLGGFRNASAALYASKCHACVGVPGYLLTSVGEFVQRSGRTLSLLMCAVVSA